MKRIMSFALCVMIAAASATSVFAHGGCHGRRNGGHHSGYYAPVCSHSRCSLWTASSSTYEFPEVQASNDSTCCWLVETQSATCNLCGQVLTRTVRHETVHQWELDESGAYVCQRCTPHFAPDHQHTQSCGTLSAPCAVHAGAHCSC